MAKSQKETKHRVLTFASQTALIFGVSLGMVSISGCDVDALANLDVQCLETAPSSTEVEPSKKRAREKMSEVAESMSRAIDLEQVHVDQHEGFRIISVPFQDLEFGSDSELFDGFEPLLIRVEHDHEMKSEVPEGNYFVRVYPAPEGGDGSAKVVFLNQQQAVVYSTMGEFSLEGASSTPRPNVLNWEAVAATTRPVVSVKISICGRRRCCDLERKGFLKWSGECYRK